jgi:hypothetical protein
MCRKHAYSTRTRTRTRTRTCAHTHTHTHTHKHTTRTHACRAPRRRGEQTHAHVCSTSLVGLSMLAFPECKHLLSASPVGHEHQVWVRHSQLQDLFLAATTSKERYFWRCRAAKRCVIWGQHLRQRLSIHITSPLPFHCEEVVKQSHELTSSLSSCSRMHG